MCKYFISIFLFFFVFDVYSQEQKKETLKTPKDSVNYKSPYGIRIGIDISKPILAATTSSYSGLEIVGDYRISKRLFIATEIGFEEKTDDEDYTNSTAKGNYIRLGINYNAYENWLDMNNELFLGYRYGFSLFDQTLNNYSHNVANEDFGEYFEPEIINSASTASNLNAHWSEFIVGIKVETFKNLFVNASISYKILMSTKEPDNFKTLYSPGFNRIFDSGTGFGFNYTISYLIPFTKK